MPGRKTEKRNLDCLIVGGGPAGLTASLYLARYRRQVHIIDAGSSRAAQIPESHNHPGFAGISGTALLDALRKQAARYGVEIKRGKVNSLSKNEEGFIARIDNGNITASRVLLATGITDASPDLPGLDRSVARASIRYCPVCDGYEASDANIAVYGPLDEAAGKALFLRTYTSRLTVLPVSEGADGGKVSELREAGITVVSLAPPAVLGNGQRHRGGFAERSAPGI